MATRSVLTTATATTRRRLTHPTEFANLRLRLVASRGLYQGTALATAAAADQDAVGTWMDTRRPYLRFQQASAPAKPKLLLEATPAGGPAVRFTAASNSILSCALSATAGVRQQDFRVQEHTVVAALRAWQTPAAQGILFAPNNASNWFCSLSTSNRMAHSFANAASTQRTLASANNAFATDTWFVGVWLLRKTAGDYATGDMLQRVRSSAGVQSSQARPGDGSLLNNSSTQWNVGALTTASSPLSVDLAELNVYGAALTDAEIDALIAEIMLTHGITP